MKHQLVEIRHNIAAATRANIGVPYVMPSIDALAYIVEELEKKIAELDVQIRQNSKLESRVLSIELQMLQAEEAAKEAAEARLPWWRKKK